MFDRLFQVHIGIHGTFSLEVADCRETVPECRPRGDSGADGAKRDRLLEQLLVVIALGDVSLEHDVGVGVDQAGQDRGPRQVD